MSELAILEAFIDLPDPRRTAGQRHEKALCLALFTRSDCGRQQRFLGNRGLAQSLWR